MTVGDIIKSQYLAAQRGALTIWTIYDHPKDHPDGFVARRFEVGDGVEDATSDMVSQPLAELRTMFFAAGLTKIDRFEGDDPVIVESWL